MNIVLTTTHDDSLSKSLISNGYQLKIDSSTRVYVRGTEIWPTIRYQETETDFVLFVGEIYEKKSLDHLSEIIKTSPHAITNVDGDFFAYHQKKSNSDITLLSDDAGILPLFYRMYPDGLAVATDCSALMADFTSGDIDNVAICEMLKYAVLIGSRTFSKRVKLLQSGRFLFFSENKINVKVEKIFVHNSANASVDVESLVDEVSFAYENALRKRVCFDSAQVGLFLSGGMNSRMTLAFLNKIAPGKTKCFSWGQHSSHEVEVARTVASVHGNPFTSFVLQPEDFLSEASAYMQEVSGLDLIMQSYLPKLRSFMSQEISHCTTGTVIRGAIGDWALSRNAVAFQGDLKTYLESNLIAKSNIFEDNMIHQLCPSLSQADLDEAKNDLMNEAGAFDGYSVADSIQSFWVNLRSKRMTLAREVSHREGMGIICANFDKDFLKAAARIPVEERFDRKFFRKIFLRAAPEYASVEFSNTSLPIAAPVELWSHGMDAIQTREKLYAEASQKLVCKGLEPLYFSHYYSDFVGYARYNQYWIDLLSGFFVCERDQQEQFLFDGAYYQTLLEDHRSMKANYRKHLLVAASIQCFLKSAISLREE